MTLPTVVSPSGGGAGSIALRAAFVVVLVMFTVLRPVEAGDAHAYWAVDLADPYTRPVATQDAFTYPPPAALFFAVLGQLPFEVFQAIWTLLIGLALLWLTGPWALLFLVIPVVASDLYLGNIHVLLAAAIVASLRWPGLWAIPLLTKPSCGVGLLWYVARGEWRRLAVAVGVTGAARPRQRRARPGPLAEVDRLRPRHRRVARCREPPTSSTDPAAPPPARRRRSWSSGAPARTGPGPCPPHRCSRCRCCGWSAWRCSRAPSRSRPGARCATSAAAGAPRGTRTS